MRLIDADALMKKLGGENVMGKFVAVAVEAEILKTLVLLLKTLRPSNSLTL